MDILDEMPPPVDSDMSALLRQNEQHNDKHCSGSGVNIKHIPQLKIYPLPISIMVFLAYTFNFFTTPFRKVYRNRANQLLSVLLALAAERSNVSAHFPKRRRIIIKIKILFYFNRNRKYKVGPLTDNPPPPNYKTPLFFYFLHADDAKSAAEKVKKKLLETNATKT